MLRNEGSVNLSQAQVDYINLAYDALIESTYQALATQTRLAAYMDQVELTFDAGEREIVDDVADERASRRANQFALHSYSRAAKVVSGRIGWHGAEQWQAANDKSFRRVA
jgi:hypothetical protein